MLSVGQVQRTSTFSMLHIRLVYIVMTVSHLPQTQKLVYTCYVRIN